MKRTGQLLVMSALMFGVQNAALSESPFPADSSEEAYNLPALESYAERQARMGEGATAWGASKREDRDLFLEGAGLAGHGPFPSKGGPIDN